MLQYFAAARDEIIVGSLLCLDPALGLGTSFGTLRSHSLRAVCLDLKPILVIGNSSRCDVGWLSLVYFAIGLVFIVSISVVR